LRSLLIILFAFIFSDLLAQDVAEAVLNKPISSIAKEAEFISTDRLGNVYLIKENNIWMYNKDGDSLRAFNSRRYGNISFLDCTDPYKILAFFSDYNVTLILDNFLSENGPPMDMQELGFDQATLVCLSQEKGFWVFDQLKQKVLRLDQNFRVTHETVNFIQWFGKRLNPNFMIQYNNRLYLNEPSSGIYVFDHFGTYLKMIPLKGLDNIQVLENLLSYVVDRKYCNYHLQALEKKCDSLNRSNVIAGRKEKGRFYLLDDKGVKIFKTN